MRISGTKESHGSKVDGARAAAKGDSVTDDRAGVLGERANAVGEGARVVVAKEGAVLVLVADRAVFAAQGQAGAAMEGAGAVAAVREGARVVAEEGALVVAGAVPPLLQTRMLVPTEFPT